VPGSDPVADRRVLLHLDDGRRVPLDPAEILVLIHRALAVNVDRVAEVCRRPGERDWELRLEPPVNRILPVARGRAESLWAAYGERGE
jgi:hypothetical protein